VRHWLALIVKDYSSASQLHNDSRFASEGLDINPIASCLSIINLDSRQVEKLEIEVSNFAVYSNEYALVYSYNWTTSQQVFTKINLTNFAQTQWSYNASQQLVSPYGIGIDPTNEDVYITDAQNYQSNGDVYRFDKNGNHIANKECGIGPSKIIFL
jgi:DNA-binding beta-propeller fold protein YncE